MTTTPTPKEAARLKTRIERGCSKMISALEGAGEYRHASMFTYVTRQVVEHDNMRPYRQMMNLRHVPVTIDEFVEGDDFVSSLDDFDVWDGIREKLREINPDVFIGAEPVIEADIGGATGTGKTTLAWITNAYQIYLLSCFESPQRFWGLAPITPIIFPFMSLNRQITMRVIYQPFREMFTSMPWVRRNLSWDKYKESSLELSNNIQVVPYLAMDTSIQGQAVCGGIMDEVSWMAVIENSKQVAGPRGEGGKFDQAELVHSRWMSRRYRSYSLRGMSAGVTCVLSNTRYKDDFMDRRLDMVEEHGHPNTVAFRLKRYEIKPDDVIDVRRGDTISILVGTDYYATRVLEPDEVAGKDYPEDAHIEHVPSKYRFQFVDDPENALRDIIGIATDAIRPFIPQRHKIVGAIERGRLHDMVPWVDVQNVELATHGMPEWLWDDIPTDRHVKRWVHIDLSKSKDRCGVAIIKPVGFVNVEDENSPGLIKTVPMFAVEVAVTLQPSATDHVEPTEVREWLIAMADRAKIQFGGVSYDGYQSQESMYMWRRAGVTATEQSLDRDMDAYMYLREALYEDRVMSVDNDELRKELVKLEYVVDKDKVDHPPKGSKDLADAVAGAIYRCSRSRYVRQQIGHFDTDGEKKRIKEPDTNRPSGGRPSSGTQRPWRRRRR